MKPHLSNKEELAQKQRIKRQMCYDAEITAYKERVAESKSPKDTSTRYELQEIIREGVRRGFSAEKIKEILNSREEFSKFADYFDSYIQNAINKTISDKKTAIPLRPYSPAVKSRQVAVKNARKEFDDMDER